MIKKLLLVIVALTSMAAYATLSKVEIDPATSKLVYIGKKLTGEHTGEVKLASGTLSFDKEVLKGGEFVIDMTTITNSDLTDKDYLKKFLDHIVSDDFFAVDKFKTAKLFFKTVKKVTANNYKVTGDLTIKGKTSPVSFDATATKEKASAKIVFDRTKYDIKYRSGKFFKDVGDKLIKDEVEVNIELTAKK